MRNANRTYLGRLVPLARAICLSDDGQHLILANGLKYPSYDDGWREPSATIKVAKGQSKREVLRASVEKAVWRELHALTVKAVGQQPGGPAALQNISDTEEAFDLWVGGLVPARGKPGKLVDTIESVFHIPAAMLTSQRVYEEGVRYAESMEFRLKSAVRTYHKELGDNLDRPKMKNRRLQVQRNAATQYWTDVEQAVQRLLEVAAAPAPLGLKHTWRDTEWGQSVRRAARMAYERACPHETTRQIRAYAISLKVFLTTPAAQTETEKEAES